MQYIGARYVPVWYVNSVDQTANWEINVEYEPLTFVTTPNNHLYISKKTVPDNIGTPADNTLYWLDMGVFTGGGGGGDQEQIDHIRNGIAPDFDIDDPYSIGDLVFYNGELYVFTSAHTAGSDWDSSEVLHTDIDSVIESMRGNIQSQITLLDGRLDDLEGWEDVSCVIRKTSSGWEILNDSGHVPEHVTGVEIDNNGQLVILFDKTYSKVGSGCICPDETYISQGIGAGASIGADRAIINIARTRPLVGVINCNGTTCSPMTSPALSGDIASCTWNNNYSGYEVTFAGYAADGGLIDGVSVQCGSSGTFHSAGIRFAINLISPSVLVAVPSGSVTNQSGWLSFIVNKSKIITPANMPVYANANFWYHGRMKK